MPSVSLITACDPARARHLPETADSVHATRSYLAGRGIDVDWVLVADGPGQLPRFRSGEHTTMLRTPTRSGVAAARNLGLIGARGDWVLPVDADDTLNAAALAEVIDRYSTRPRPGTLPGLPTAPAPAPGAGPAETGQVAWVVADHGWHDRPGTVARVSGPVPLPAGRLADTWSAGWPACVGNLLVRRSAALAVGGWPALPVAEDVGFALLVGERFAGVCDPVPVWRRREWDGQVTAESAGRGGDAHRRGLVADVSWGVAQMLNEQRNVLFPGRGAVAAPR